jgi:trk system potassium uptake protein TrkA
LLTTIRILDLIRGHDTVAVEYLAGGQIQLRKVHLEEGSLLTRKPLRHVELPAGSLVVALERGGEVIVPSGSDQAAAGDDALVLALSDVIDRVERMLTAKPRQPASVVLAGGGRTGATVARALIGMNLDVTLIERQRRRAEELAASFPTLRVLCGDATDVGLLRSERVGHADTLVALTGRDEQNLMACLVAHEVGVPQVVALVERAETLHLWRRVGLVDVVAPRALAYERIRAYIESGYEASILSRHKGAAVLERRLEAASPAAGVALAEMGAPRGLIVGAVVRGDQAFVPRGRDRLEAGDTVFLFAREEELDTVNLLFPGRDRT